MSTKSQSNDRVFRGSMMSIPCKLSPPVASAVLKGDAIAFSLASIS